MSRTQPNAVRDESLLAHLLDRLRFDLVSQPRLSPREPLPMLLNQYTTEFAVQPARSLTAV